MRVKPIMYAKIKLVSHRNVVINMPAFHENQVALYNLGDIYYEGKLGFPKNQKQAIINYKKAALKGHDKSINKLKSLKINVYDD
ncbi:12401_t:CDS:2 [Entrophospora sp. SA101]|nr:12401_t:CDS:2 [Entrophospora sp. SA101]